MGYRWYTSQEYARLNRLDAARAKAKMGKTDVKYKIPIQNKLAAVIHLIQEDRVHLANMYLRMKSLSPKQIAAAQRWIDRTIK